MKGSFRQTDLDVPNHRVIFLAIEEFARTTQNFAQLPEDGIPMDYLVPILGGMVKSGEVDKSELPGIESVLDDIESVSLHSQLLMPMIPGFLAYQRQRRAINQAVSNNDMGGDGSLAEELFNIKRESDSIGGRDRSGLTEASDLLETMMPTETKIVIGTGISSIDALLDGGVAKSQTAMLCAYTGLGKSAFGVNVCQNAAKMGFRSAFISLEMSAAQLMCRYTSAIASVSYTLLWKGDSTGELSMRQIKDDVLERVRRLREADPVINAGYANFSIAEMTGAAGSMTAGSPATTDDIRNLCQSARNAGRPIDLIVIDYLELLDLPDTKQFAAARKETRDKLGELSVQLDRICRDFQLVMWILTQANDEGSKAPSPGLTAARDSRKKNDPISVWCSLGATEGQRKEGIFNFRCAKNRDGRTFTVKIRGEMEFQKFMDYDQTSTERASHGRRNAPILELEDDEP